MRWKTMIAIAGVLALILTAGAVLAQSGERPADAAVADPLVPQYEVTWFAQAGGGPGSPMVGDGWSVSSTLGQVAIGQAGGLPHGACAGFWCGWQPYSLYLPIVLRNS